MIIITRPPAIHTLFNPVLTVFEKQSMDGDTAELSIVTENNEMLVEVDFSESAVCEVELSGFLKSMLAGLPYSVSQGITVDSYQSFTYQLKQGNTVFGTYTAVNSVAQIRDSQDLTVQHGRILTGFKKLLAYDKIYPSDVSVFPNTEDWNGKALVLNRINRIAFSCADDVIELTPEKSCTLEWTDWICQVVDTDFIPIYTTDEFLNINTGTNPDNLPYVLMNDLDFDGIEFINIYQPNAAVYGQGYTLKNINAFTGSQNTSPMNFSEASDLIFEGFIYTDNAPVIAGQDINVAFIAGSLIENCHFKDGKFIVLDEGKLHGGAFSGLTSRYCSVTECNGSSKYLATLATQDCLFVNNMMSLSTTSFATLASSPNRIIVKKSTYTSSNGNYGVTLRGVFGVNNCVVIDTVLQGNDASAFIISNAVPQGDVNYSYNSSPLRGNDNMDGIIITESQAKNQSFYEGLGYDFDGSTQDDRQPVWAMGADGYPEIVKPFKKFSTDDAGNAFAKTLIHKTYISGVEESSEEYSILTDVNPVLTEEQYSLLSSAEVEARAQNLINNIPKCDNYEIINGVVNYGLCDENTEVVIGYDEVTALDFGAEILIHVTEY